MKVGPVKRFALILLALSAATALVAEWLGVRIAIYSGALGGMLLGLVGYLVAVHIAARQREVPRAQAGRWDIWTCWGSGMLVRLVLLGLLALAYGYLLPLEYPTALLSLAAVYLVLLSWETAWLYYELVSPLKSSKSGA